MPSNIPEILLNNGQKIPCIGFGCLNQKNCSLNKLEETVKKAIDIGYRYFNCTWGNETQIGNAIRKKIKEGVVRREDLFIMARLDNENLKRNLAIPGCRWSLKRLGLDYLDCFIMPSSHHYFDDEIDYSTTWRGMEECVSRGLTRSIGVANFFVGQLTTLLSNAQLRPVVNELEVHMNYSHQEIRDFCRTENILVIARKPFGSMLAYVNSQRNDLFDFEFGEENNDMHGYKVTRIASKYNKTNFQIALRYLIQVGTVPIPKTVCDEHLYENTNVFDFHLTEDEMSLIKSFDDYNYSFYE